MENQPTNAPKEGVVENQAQILSLEKLFDPNYKEESKEEVIVPVDSLEELMKKDEVTPPVVEKVPPVEEVIPPVVEPIVPPEGETPPEDAPPVPPTDNVDYKQIVKDLWGDEMSTIVVEGEDGVDVEVPFEDFEMTSDSLKAIISTKLEEIEENSKKDKISIDSVSQLTRTIIDIENNGGDIKDALSIYQTYQDPLNSLDLSQESDQIAVVSLRLQAEGRGEDEILDYIDVYKTKGNLEEKAILAKETLEEEVSKSIKKQADLAEENKKKKDKLFKEYKANLKDVLKDAKIKESIKQKIISSTTKKDEDNKYELDNIYKTIRNNPETVADLAYFLLDKESYLKDSSVHQSNTEKKKTFLKLKMSADNKKTGAIIKEKVANGGSKDPLADLFNE